MPRRTSPPNPDPDTLSWCYGHEAFHPRTAFPSAGTGDGRLRGRCTDYVRAARAVYDATRQAEQGSRLNASREVRRTREQEAARKRRRNARLDANDGDRLDPLTILMLAPGDTTTCFWCGTDIVIGPGTGAADHVVPVAAGGRTQVGNIVPSCWRDNSSKSDRDVATWLAVLTQAGLVPPRGALARLATGAALPGLLAEAGLSA